MARQYPPLFAEMADQKRGNRTNVGTSEFACSGHGFIHRFNDSLGNGAGIGPDPALRQPGRSQIARPLHAEREHHPRPSRTCLRRPGGPRQGPEDHPCTGGKLGNTGADPLAIPFAQGREIPERRPLHRRRRAFLGGTRPEEGLEPADPHSQRHQGRQGRRLHGGLHPANAQSHSQFAVGYLVHHGQEVGRGEQRRRAHARRGNDAELCLAQRQRHRPLHRREPSARRQDRLQGQPELVAQAGA